jgi:hypothetical protein
MMRMFAKRGDWLVVKSASDARPARRAAILATAADGRPPYTVRWLDTDHEAIVFPGPDAEVITVEQQRELDRRQAARAERVLSELLQGPIEPVSPRPRTSGTPGQPAS